MRKTGVNKKLLKRYKKVHQPIPLSLAAIPCLEFSFLYESILLNTTPIIRSINQRSVSTTNTTHITNIAVSMLSKKDIVIFPNHFYYVKELQLVNNINIYSLYIKLVE